jgi:hypothetical protein
MASLLLRIVLFVVVLPFLVLWLAAGAITWGADAILRASRERGRPPFAIARRTSDARFRSTAAVFLVLLLAIGASGGGDGTSRETTPREAVATAAASRADKAAETEAAEADAAAKARAERRATAARLQRAERRAARLEQRRRAEERRRARLAAEGRRERREAREQRALLLAQERELERQQKLEAAAAESSDCHSSYEGACLDPNASDYDCEGGSGDGPMYTGTVTVVGPDDYDLERDGDGIACDVS